MLIHQRSVEVLFFALITLREGSRSGRPGTGFLVSHIDLAEQGDRFDDLMLFVSAPRTSPHIVFL